MMETNVRNINGKNNFKKIIKFLSYYNNYNLIICSIYLKIFQLFATTT